MSRLLISVRSVSEAWVCVHNGADMIDVKEPSRGSMGMAGHQTIRAIAREVPPRFPVSAALGEWTEWDRAQRFPEAPEGIAYLKIGLGGAAGGPARDVETWRERFGRFCGEVCARAGIYSEPSWVAVAYADWERARSPRPDEVLDFAAANGFSFFLLDTFGKDGTSLFDWMDPDSVARLADMARFKGLEVALAGSLRLPHIERALRIAPEVVAIRTAACQGQDREATIDAGAVRELAAVFASVRAPSAAVCS